MKTTVIQLNPAKPDLEQIRQAVFSALEGKVVAFPTETVYGIGALASKREAVQRIYALKKRPQEKPLSYHIGDLGQLGPLGIRVTNIFRFFKKQFWPGPVTLIVWNEREEKIGIRYPKNEIACRLISQCGEAFLATSANASGAPSPKTAEEVIRVFSDQIDVVIDGGRCAYAEDSTVVDLTNPIPKILRKGALAGEVEKAIEKVASNQFLRKTILFVCTGNTCRSPMAEAWLKSELKRQGLGGQIEVASCGTHARDGFLSEANTELVLRNHEMRLENFKTRACRRDDVMEADLIFAMTDQHEEFIASLYPGTSGKIITLGVEDPIGMNAQAYEHSFQTIKQKLQQHWKEVIR